MEIFNNLITSPDISASTMSADTIYLDGKPLTWGSGSTQPEQITIHLEQVVVGPQKTIYVIKNTVHPIQRQQSVNVVVTKKTVTPAPVIKEINNMEAYLRICGTYAPASKAQCMQCVDKYLSENIITSKLQLTKKGTGCNCK